MLEKLLTFPWKNLVICGATYAGIVEHTAIIIIDGKVIYHILNKFFDLNKNNNKLFPTITSLYFKSI